MKGLRTFRDASLHSEVLNKIGENSKHNGSGDDNDNNNGGSTNFPSAYFIMLVNMFLIIVKDYFR